MSSNGRALAIIAQFTLASDGLVAGLALAYVAVQIWRNYRSTSSALHKIRQAPTIRISDLRSLLDSSLSADDSEFSGQKLVVVRGLVQAKSAFHVLNSHNSEEAAVVLQRTQTSIYNEWRGLFGRTIDLRTILGSFWEDQRCTSLRVVPFVLVENAHSDYAVVSLEGSKHPLPLITPRTLRTRELCAPGCLFLQSVPASPYTFLDACPVGLLDEEKILPVGKEVTAVGICGSQDGIPQIKSCRDLPYFLSDMTKDQMVADLVCKKNVRFWSGIVLGSLSIGILGYAITRKWRRWKDWWQQRRLRQSRNAAAATAIAISTEDQAEDETGDVPDTELCVVCLVSRRRSAFVPCGHRICCEPCALSVERDSSPKCPICRQTIWTTVIIYEP